MITLGIFTILSLVIFGYLWFQWDKLSMVIDAIGMTSKMIEGGVVDNERLIQLHGKGKVMFLKFLAKFKQLMWVPIGIILFLNFIVACILSGIINLILILF